MQSIEQELGQIQLFQYVHPHLFASALPNADQLAQIKAYGIDTLIHIAPNSAHPDSQALDRLCLDLGLNYIQIPLDYDSPAADQALLILDLIDFLCTEKMLWLCCPDLQRCSSLLYVYRQFFMQMDLAAAHPLLEATWEPNPTWTGLIHALTLQLQGRKSTQELQQDLNANNSQNPHTDVVSADHVVDIDDASLDHDGETWVSEQD